MHFEQSAILTVHNHVITRNPRISVTHDKHDKHKTWYLHINNVQEEDKGRYMCQINTVTAKTQFGYLHVVGMYLHRYYECSVDTTLHAFFIFRKNSVVSFSLWHFNSLTLMNRCRLQWDQRRGWEIRFYLYQTPVKSSIRMNYMCGKWQRFAAFSMISVTHRILKEIYETRRVFSISEPLVLFME